jgi:predicted transcriptional regulator
MEVRPETHFSEELRREQDRKVAQETHEAQIDEYAKTLMEKDNECHPNTLRHTEEFLAQLSEHDVLEIAACMNSVLSLKEKNIPATFAAEMLADAMNKMRNEYCFGVAKHLAREHFNYE